MPSVTFRGMKIMHMGLAGVKNGFMLTLDIRADLSEPVAKEFGWEGLLGVEGWSKSELRSAVGKGDASITPNGATADKQLAVSFDNIMNFKVFDNEENTDKKKSRAKHELRCQLRTSDPKAWQDLGKYWRSNQNSASQMRIVFQELTDAPPPPAAGDSSVAVEKA